MTNGPYTIEEGAVIERLKLVEDGMSSYHLVSELPNDQLPPELKQALSFF